MGKSNGRKGDAAKLWGTREGRFFLIVSYKRDKS